MFGNYVSSAKTGFMEYFQQEMLTLNIKNIFGKLALLTYNLASANEFDSFVNQY